jgi:hypothetical protein
MTGPKSLKGQAPEAVINSHPGAALAEHGGRMAVDNCSHWEKTNSKPGSILNADGNENLVMMLNSGKMKFATFRKMELQYYGKMICNFWEKCLAKNTEKGDTPIGANRLQRDRTLIYTKQESKFQMKNSKTLL